MSKLYDSATVFKLSRVATLLQPVLSKLKKLTRNQPFVVYCILFFSGQGMKQMVGGFCIRL